MTIPYPVASGNIEKDIQNILAYAKSVAVQTAQTATNYRKLTEIPAPTRADPGSLFIYVRDDGSGTNTPGLFVMDPLGHETQLSGLGTGGASALNQLTDVQIGTLASGQVLRYNATDSLWENTQLAHSDLSGIGTNTHAQLDSHVASTTNPHSTTYSQVNAIPSAADGSATGTISFSSFYPQGPGSIPPNDTALADVAYVKSFANGFLLYTQVQVATTAALPANTYANGTAGVGATITYNSNGLISTIDTYQPVVGDRILVKNEATAANNGVYTLTIQGSVSQQAVLTRATDFDQSAEIKQGSLFFVVNGASFPSGNGATQWALLTGGTVTVGTTGLTFVQANSQPNITASLGSKKVGNDIEANLSASGGLALSGNAIIANVDNATVGLNGSNQIAVKSLGITNTQINDVSPTKLSSAVTYDKGGTGQTSYAKGDVVYASGTNILSKLNASTNGYIMTLVAGVPTWAPATSGGGAGSNSVTLTKNIDFNTTAFGIGNSTAETTIYTYTFAGGTWGTTGLFHLLLQGHFLNNTGSTHTMRMRVKLGTTLILDKTTGQIPTYATNAYGAWQMDVFMGSGGTNIQNFYMNGAWEAAGSQATIPLQDTGRGAVDMTVNQTLTVTLQNSAAGNTEFYKELASLDQNNVTQTFGAPIDASYLVLGTNTSLSNERALNLGSGLSGVDGGANGNYTISPDLTVLVDKTTSQTVQNKTLDDTNAATLKDGSFTIENTTTTSKKFKFDALGISTSTTRTLTVPDATDTLALLAATQTFTNKRITKRVNSASAANSLTPNADSYDIEKITLTSGTAFTFNAPTGTPTDGQMFEYIVTALAGGAVAYTYNAAFVGTTDLALPTTGGAASKKDRFLWQYDSVASKYVLVSKVFGQ